MHKLSGSHRVEREDLDQANLIQTVDFAVAMINATESHNEWGKRYQYLEKHFCYFYTNT